ncbi:uncharacterized protein GGS22DRAFT_168354 [Annulohypoxylon maeteangense]|uniref:uncharacterized protein n=1 Tax=Annulohypoxylon maeteangense TaxID=1927788 RepID=UPI002008C22F|nr:uncharacterized protein GGS22DRAFT_168354 [Annulohypoxylon maeteangense]KAI0883297.1 hypothetical protein GGS22DRAFT_168354 [Annulohypoxylon maeteangense]
MYSPIRSAIISSLLLLSSVTALKPNVTAVAAVDGHSTIQCWQLDNEFTSKNVLNRSSIYSADLGGVANLSYTFIPPNYDQGVHSAPFNQWVIFIKGIGLITVPNDNTTAYVAPGETGIVFAADTPDITSDGHRSQYLGVTESIIMQIPALNNQVPAHTVLHPGGCVTSEMSGLWELALGISSQT